MQLADANNNDSGTALRSDVRQRNLIHRAAYIFVLSPVGSLCVQQRSQHKDIFPSYWDLAAGGVVEAGETPKTTATRELKEELNIDNQPLESHGDFYYEDAQCKVWGSVYSCLWGGEIRAQTSEIADWRFVGVEEVGRFIREQRITPTTLHAYQTLLGLDALP
ncbi:nudix hydrolase [gamma proteobacterium HTCC5015]|nr:nudix hydrolase [gamma proteobacterium HTCC5015]